jgi:hypothetical protein
MFDEDAIPKELLKLIRDINPYSKYNTLHIKKTFDKDLVFYYEGNTTPVTLTKEIIRRLYELYFIS